MSQQVGKLIAQAGPVAVAVIGASTTAIGVATVIIAAGAAAALALAGYGLYRYLSADGTAPIASLGDKAETMWELLRDNKLVGPVPFVELLEKAASGEIQPTDKVRQVGSADWVEARAAG